MAITVDTAASSTALTTVTRTSTETGITVTARLIQAVSDEFERFVGYPLAQQTYTETLPGYGGIYLTVSRTPVDSVSAITYDGSTVSSVTIEDADAGVLYRKSGFYWTAQYGVELDSYVLPDSELPLYSVTYVAGWTLPTDVADGTLPAQIEWAAQQTAVAWHKSRKGGGDVKAKAVGDLRITYADHETSSLPAFAREILEPYQRIK